jgi:hypothetical protein
LQQKACLTHPIYIGHYKKLKLLIRRWRSSWNSDATKITIAIEIENFSSKGYGCK